MSTLDSLEMPDRPLTVLGYAASASLAAIALTYFVHPAFLFDRDLASGPSRRGAVGLLNNANDCFINAVLQALTGLGHLRAFLVREVHRRQLDSTGIYDTVKQPSTLHSTAKLLSLQQASVTRALQDLVERLSERPAPKSPLSAAAFVRSLELAFGTSVSHAQQDAQELLQLVAERLLEEFVAGRNARQKTDSQTDASETFPLEGKTRARIECQTCGFEPRARPTSFVMLNLMVPQGSSSCSLHDCLDTHFKREMIDDYSCDKCRLEHAISQFSGDAATLEKLRYALATDPEALPEDVRMPDRMPKRRVARHVELTSFPAVLVVHLSRSIFDPGTFSSKNTAKVSFPAQLALGGILNRRQYELSAAITHKGTHQSGHYEALRKQNLRFLPKMDQAPDEQTRAEPRRSRSRRRGGDRWWRISDDKVKECSINDVLDLKKEAYLLFYEMAPQLTRADQAQHEAQ